MNIKIRAVNFSDLDNIYNLHLKCFKDGDIWYKSIISLYIINGLVIECLDTNEIIGVLLEGDIQPCDKLNNLSQNTNLFDNIVSIDNQQSNTYVFESDNINESILYNKPDFENLIKPYEKYFGIVMLCVHPDFQKKNLATQLITEHINNNKNKLLILQVRKSNTKAFNLYKKLNYETVGYIKNKYFFPNEDSILMLYQEYKI